MVALAVPMVVFYVLSIVVGAVILALRSRKQRRPRTPTPTKTPESTADRRPAASGCRSTPALAWAGDRHRHAGLRPRPLPARGDRRPRRRPVGAGGRADRLGQDRRRRARRARRRWPTGGKAFYTTPIKALSNQKYGDLVRAARRRAGRSADRRQRDQRRRAGRRDDHRGAAQHDLRRSPALDGLRFVVLDEVHYLQDAYRGPGVGGGHHPPPADGAAGVPVGHGVERRRAGRLDRAPSAGPRRWWSRTAGPSSSTTCYLRRRHAAPDELAPAPDAGRRAAEPRRQPLRRRPRDAWPGRSRRPAAPALRHAPPGRGGRAARATTTCCPAIYFIFSRAACDDAVRACVGAGPAPHRRRRAAAHPRDRRAPRRAPHRRRPRRARLRPLARRPRGGHRRPPRRAWSRRSRRRSRPASPRVSSRSCSPPRRWRSASTCRRAPW